MSDNKPDAEGGSHYAEDSRNESIIPAGDVVSNRYSDIDPTAITLTLGAAIDIVLLIESLHRAFIALYERPVYDSHTQSLIRTARETLQRLQSKLGV